LIDERDFQINSGLADGVEFAEPLDDGDLLRIDGVERTEEDGQAKHDHNSQKCQCHVRSSDETDRVPAAFRELP
jgi:hypothetical protein